MKYKNEAGEIGCECNLNLTINAFEVYKNLNPEKFYNCHCFSCFKESVENICKAHKQQIVITEQSIEAKKLNANNNNVLLAFSGGLDSMFQAFYLKEQGYNVTLFHCKNMNYYTNGKEQQTCKQFSQQYNFPIIYSYLKQNTKQNPYKKYWKENSFKNILLYSLMVDYCIDNNISNISCGDDLRLDINDAVVGTNIADATQITLPFVNKIKEVFNINFIFVKDYINKAQRLRKLDEYNALDLFYSCVNPGKFNEHNHNRIQQKFNVKLEKYNCGVCRKCAFHTLLRHYYLNVPYPKEFIEFTWEKIANGADFAFFNPKLPLEVRIKNLIDY